MSFDNNGPLQNNLDEESDAYVTPKTEGSSSKLLQEENDTLISEVFWSPISPRIALRETQNHLPDTIQKDDNESGLLLEHSRVSQPMDEMTTLMQHRIMQEKTAEIPPSLSKDNMTSSQESLNTLSYILLKDGDTISDPQSQEFLLAGAPGEWRPCCGCTRKSQRLMWVCIIILYMITSSKMTEDMVLLTHQRAL
jgi:hypothetical protein